MNRTMHGSSGAIALAGLFALAGCASTDTTDDEEPVGETQQRQLDSGSNVWRKYTFSFPDGSHLATVHVFNQTVGTFVTTYEYWYANKDSFNQIGTNDLSIAHVDNDASTTPTDPGYTNEQRFTVVKNASWGAGFSIDPLNEPNCGPVYSGPNNAHLRVKVAGGVISRVSWYQVLTTGTTPANITPNGSFVDVGGTVGVPSGNTGYDITQKPGAWP